MPSNVIIFIEEFFRNNENTLTNPTHYVGHTSDHIPGSEIRTTTG